VDVKRGVQVGPISSLDGENFRLSPIDICSRQVHTGFAVARSVRYRLSVCEVFDAVQRFQGHCISTVQSGPVEGIDLFRFTRGAGCR